MKTIKKINVATELKGFIFVKTIAAEEIAMSMTHFIFAFLGKPVKKLTAIIKNEIRIAI